MRIALVGLGEAGYTIHLPALAAMPAVTVVGAADPDPSRRDRAAKKFRTPVFAEFSTMLSKTAPDVVIVGTPPDTHADYCLQAIAAGCHVICEKPFVTTLSAADRVIQSAAAHGRRVAVNHQFREMPIFRAISDEAARVGTDRIAFAQVWQLMDMAPWAEAGWRGRMAQRTLYEAGVHLIDFLLALFGEMPVAVTASTSMGGGRGSATDAIALVTLEFSRGRLAQVTQNRLCKGQMQYFEVRAETPDASLRASFGGRSRLTAGLYRSPRPHIRFEHGLSGLAWKESGASRTVLARNPKAPMVAATRSVFERTLEAFRTGGQVPTSAEAARDVLEVIAACYQSALDGRRITLDETTARRGPSSEVAV